MTTRDSNNPLQLRLLAQLLGVDRLAGRHVRQHPGHSNVPVRLFPRPGRGGPAKVIIGLTHERARLVREVTARRRAEISAIVAAMPEESRQAVVAALSAFAQAAGETTPSVDTAARLGW
jgi:hypothetical protein